MSKKKIKKHTIKPDSKYSSVFVRKLINKLMLHGELRKAQKIVYSAAEIVEKQLNLPFDKILETVIDNVKTGIELRKRKIGASNQKVSVKISPTRNTTLALQMLKNTLRETKRKGKPFFKLLAEEISDAYNKKGTTIKKKENILKEAESSRVSAY